MNLKLNPGFFGAKCSDTGDQLALVQEWAAERHAHCDKIEERVKTMEASFYALVAKEHQLEDEYKTSSFWHRLAIRRKIATVNAEIVENRDLRNILYKEAWKRS